MVITALIASDPPVEFTCPRCGHAAQARFYGPCPTCVLALRAQSASDGGREVEVAEYVPKMNVTPNAVALKDD